MYFCLNTSEGYAVFLYLHLNGENLTVPKFYILLTVHHVMILGKGSTCRSEVHIRPAYDTATDTE
jgi:hypothetical protein